MCEPAGPPEVSRNRHISQLLVLPAMKVLFLFVWDFDWTVVNCNSDEYVPAQFLGQDATSDGFRDLIRKNGTNNDAVDWDWHKCVEIMVGRAMNDEGGGATPDDILAAAARMPFLDQVQLAIAEISEKGDQMGQMILSDGNTLFIQAFLKANDMEKCFDEGIMTNIGEFVAPGEDGGKPALKVTHQSAKYGGHNCPRCARSPNLCKTQALRDKLSQMGDIPAKIVYVGDGANDACPAINVLRECDVLLARGGVKRSEANGRSGAETDEETRDKREESKSGTSFGILSALEEAKVDGKKIPKCHVSEWRTGAELRSLIRDVISGE